MDGGQQWIAKAGGDQSPLRTTVICRYGKGRHWKLHEYRGLERKLSVTGSTVTHPREITSVITYYLVLKTIRIHLVDLIFTVYEKSLTAFCLSETGCNKFSFLSNSWNNIILLSVPFYTVEDKTTWSFWYSNGTYFYPYPYILNIIVSLLWHEVQKCCWIEGGIPHTKTIK